MDGNSYGIPVGPYASRVLGEAVLIDVDAYLKSQGIDYVRWVDDYNIFVRSEYLAQSTRLLHKSWHVIVARTPTFRVANASQNSPCSIRPCHDCRPIASVAYPHQR